MTDIAPESVDEKTPAKIDFSKYAVGQEYEGKAISAKQFGIFVDISTGTNVLICLLYTSPSPRDRTRSRMPSSA